jgi:hypothetical protein
MPEEECAGQRHARILTVAAYLQQTPRQSRGAGFCRLAHGQASGETNRAASCSDDGPCRHRAGSLGGQPRRARAPSKLCRKKATLAAANEMPDAKLRLLFEGASSLADEKQKSRDSDALMARWLAQQVRERGVKAVAELLGYDEANLAKVVAGKRGLSRGLRKLIIDQRGVKENNPA